MERGLKKEKVKLPEKPPEKFDIICPLQFRLIGWIMKTRWKVSLDLNRQTSSGEIEVGLNSVKKFPRATMKLYSGEGTGSYSLWVK